jgi:hypothetical protein
MLCARSKLSGEIPRRNSTKISYLREIRYQAKDKLSARNRLSVKVFTYVISRQYLKAPNLLDEKAKQNQHDARVPPPTAILPCLAAADDDSNSQHSPPSSVPALLFSSAVRAPRITADIRPHSCAASRWHLSLVSPRLRRPLMMR